jgi:8-oxo-dGTP diphosphatase
MLTALDLPDRPLSTAECVVVHLTDTGAVHAVERHRPRA